MRYQMRERVFSIADQFTIKNDLGEDVGFVDGKTFSLGDKLSFLDVLGREVAYIEQRLLSWGPTYEIFRNGYLAAIVKKELFRITPRFSVDVPGPDDLTVEGDLWKHEYFFVRGGKCVATVSKQWFTMAHTYGVEVLDAEDHILILASCVVIDLVNDDDARR